jgi:hypothetical protein
LFYESDILTFHNVFIFSIANKLLGVYMFLGVFIDEVVIVFANLDPNLEA